jgi:hypothetical protein
MTKLQQMALKQAIECLQDSLVMTVDCRTHVTEETKRGTMGSILNTLDVELEKIHTQNQQAYSWLKALAESAHDNDPLF